jgi:general stress protein YciG
MTDETPTNAAPQKRKGFASMPPERLKEIATLGGKSVPAENRAFSRNRELASAAGKKSGRMTRVKESQSNA